MKIYPKYSFIQSWLKEKELLPARKYWLKYWISVYTPPLPGFIGMLSIQEDRICAPLVDYT
jgi:hypothetical protein